MAGRTDLPDQNEDRRTRGARPEPTLTKTEARQGFTGRPVLIILLTALLLLMLIWVPVEWWGNAIEPENPANESIEPVPQSLDGPVRVVPQGETTATE